MVFDSQTGYILFRFALRALRLLGPPTELSRGEGMKLTTYVVPVRGVFICTCTIATLVLLAAELNRRVKIAVAIPGGLTLLPEM